MSWSASAAYTPNGFISANGIIVGGVYSVGTGTASAFNPAWFPFRVRYNSAAMVIPPSTMSAFDDILVEWQSEGYGSTGSKDATGSGRETIPVSAIWGQGYRMDMSATYHVGWDHVTQSTPSGILEWWQHEYSGHAYGSREVLYSTSQDKLHFSYWISPDYYSQDYKCITATDGTISSIEYDVTAQALRTTATADAATYTGWYADAPGVLRYGRYGDGADDLWIVGISGITKDKPLPL